MSQIYFLYTGSPFLWFCRSRLLCFHWLGKTSLRCGTLISFSSSFDYLLFSLVFLHTCLFLPLILDLSYTDAFFLFFCFFSDNYSILTRILAWKTGLDLKKWWLESFLTIRLSGPYFTSASQHYCLYKKKKKIPFCLYRVFGCLGCFKCSSMDRNCWHLFFLN